MLHPVMVLSPVSTAAAAADSTVDDDGNRYDVIAPHPEHLLVV